MSQRKDIGHETRLKLTRRLKSQVYALLGAKDTELRSYSHRYGRISSDKWSKATFSEIIKQIHKQKLVLGADFHSHSQSQRTHLRVLRQISLAQPILLFLECFETKDQKWVDKFLKNKISEKELLLKTQWGKKWGFKFEDYRPLLELAKERKWNVRALNLSSSRTKRTTLSLRDSHFSKEILQARLEDKSQIIYVIVGEMHLAPAHLPKQLESLGLYLPVILHQNIDHLYFKHTSGSGAHLGEDTVLKRSSTEFCILNSPPWLRWQSYLTWLESQSNDEIEDVGDVAQQLVFRAAELLLHTLKIKVDVDGLSIFGPGELDLNQIQSAKSFDQNTLSSLQQMMILGQSFVIPQLELLYLGRLDINHATELIGLWHHVEKAKITSVMTDMPKDFARLVWHRSVGKIISQTINPHRKIKSSFPVEVIKICRSFEKHKGLYRPRHKSSYWLAAENLAGITTHNFFSAYRNTQTQRKLLSEWIEKEIG